MSNYGLFGPSNASLLEHSITGESRDGHYGRVAAWGENAVQVDPTWDTDTALAAADLAWEPTYAQCRHTDPVTGETVDTAGAFAGCRNDNGRQLSKGTVGDVFAAVRNREHYNFGQPLVDAGAERLNVVNAQGGALSAVTYKLPDAQGWELTDGQSFNFYGLSVNGHTGQRAFSFGVVALGNECLNTLAVKLRSTPVRWELRHTTTVRDRLTLARKSLALSAQYVADFQETAKRLAAVAVTVEEVDAYVNAWVPLPAERGQDKARSERDALRDNVLGTPTVPADLRLTRWGVFQGATEYFEHVREPRADRRTAPRDRRVLSALFGGPVAVKRDRVWADVTRGVDLPARQR